MKADINLLSEIEEGKKKQEKIEKFIKILSFASLAVVGLSAIVVFLLERQFGLQAIEQKQKVILQQISQYNKREAKLFVINNRLKNISEILEARRDYYKTINSLIQKIPVGVSIDKLTINDNKIFLVASSGSLLSINNLINNLIDMAKRKETITILLLNSLTAIEKTSSYSVSLDAEIKL